MQVLIAFEVSNSATAGLSDRSAVFTRYLPVSCRDAAQSAAGRAGMTVKRRSAQFWRIFAVIAGSPKLHQLLKFDQVLQQV